MSRVVIFSASVGAGHDSAAKALADRLTARGFAVDRHDFLTLMPAGRAVCGSYRRIITHAPALYQCIYSRTERAARPGLVQRHLLRGAEQAVLDAIPADAVAAVATYPLALERNCWNRCRMAFDIRTGAVSSSGRRLRQPRRLLRRRAACSSKPCSLPSVTE